MYVIAVDSGENNGFVVVKDSGEVVKHQTIPLDEVLVKIEMYDPELLIMERAGRTQREFIFLTTQLKLLGRKVYLVSPGEWKPNPLCRTTAAETPGWSPHERDALSLIKYYWLTAFGYPFPSGERR